MTQYRNQSPSQPQSRRNPPVAGIVYLICALILGIFILIAGIVVSSGMKKLAGAIENQSFSDSFNSPDKLTLTNNAQKKYLSGAEASEYLNISEDELSQAIADGRIDEYIITSKGYSISIESLDDYFSDEAYKIQQKLNSAEGAPME